MQPAHTTGRTLRALRSTVWRRGCRPLLPTGRSAVQSISTALGPLLRRLLCRFKRSRGTEATMFIVRESFKLLGLPLGPEKIQTPASIAMVLGAAFNTQSPASQRILRVEPKPTRVANLICFMIDEILAANSPTLAASILGQFGFLCSTLYGKVGQCCTGAIRRHQMTIAWPRTSLPVCSS